MGKRWLSNNYRVSNLGYVGSSHRIDLRVFKKFGWMKDGQRTHWQTDYPSSGRMVADLRPGYDNLLVIDIEGIRQNIQLVSRPTPFGGRRWYFIDDLGQRCERMFLFGNRFVSRKTARLTYRTQSAGTETKWVNERDDLDQALNGNPLKGPARGRRRERLQARRDLLDKAIEGVGAGIAGHIMFVRAQALLRKNSSIQRLEAAKKGLERQPGLSSELILQRFESYIAAAKTQTPKPPFSVNAVCGPAASKAELPPQHVDLSILRRLDIARPGDVVGKQLGWPQEWIGNPGKQIFAIVDMRDSTSPCAMFIIDDDGLPLATQFFWIVEVRAAFGRTQMHFLAAEGGDTSEILYYRDGVFVF
ncbi:hypothetical protein [Afipia broomeae]|uniref:Uncharacterized protein n=1 Tax=Afipia broomeae ATCC 49717 TaxID=883078 RepID=K8PPK7_9BRAD|nr:hypothetical protein [Afipia broomeae]EKS41455.1 hypothetical protein HMPREF9695_00547 [Afipia broomeae ATCC 49717]